MGRGSAAVMKQEWKQWEGRVLSGRFPLRQFLGASDHGAVFLTERGGGKAAIKLVAANGTDAEGKLAQWKQAAELSHPHLIQIFEIGRAQVEGAEVLFLVTECADEDLSQVLPQRPLTTAEAKEMLNPVVEALGYLHTSGFVHGHLKPSNILASGDQVKLSSDRIGKIGDRFAEAGEPDAYDPPEKAHGKNSAASDVWSLGVTLVEVLTRQLPKTNGKDNGELKLPEGLSSPFLDVARNSLWRDPGQRWSISEIASRLGNGSGPQKEKAVIARPVAVAHLKEKALLPVQKAGKPQSSRIWIGITLVIAAILGGLFVARRGAHDQSAAPAVAQQVAPRESESTGSAPAPQTIPKAPEPPAKPTSTGSNEIVERVIPTIPKSARDTIQGKVKVRVRADVDASGKVVNTKFETRGPSEYFARQAKQAAERWKFAPAQDDARHWEVLFEFTRGGTQVIPSRVNRGH